MNTTKSLPSTHSNRPPLERSEQHWVGLVGCYTICYFVLACTAARHKLLWNDELFTFYISRQPTMSNVWNALLTGAEQLPPFFYVITRAFASLFGTGRVAFRLPELISFWFMTISLFFFMRRRCSVAYGLIAMLFPALTGAVYYAYEARPYGIVLGFCGIALLCWQMAAEGRMRALSLAGLTLSLGAALSCHYYAIISLAPFVFAECVRTLTRRRVDFWMWIALFAGLLPLALFLPLIKAAAGYSSHFWARPHWSTAFGFYRGLLSPAVLPLLAVPITLAVYFELKSVEGEAPIRKPLRIPVHEIALAVGFVLVPILGLVLAKTVTGAFTDRYAMSAVIGLGILLAYSISVITTSSGVGLLISAVFMTSFVVDGLKTCRQWEAQAQDQLTTYRFLQLHDAGGIPVVIAGPHLFFELSHKAAELHEKTNFVFLADKVLALRYTDTDDVELGLLALKQWAPLDVRDFHQFCASQREFLIYGDSEPFAWIVPELLKEGHTLVVTAENDGRLLFRVLLGKDQ